MIATPLNQILNLLFNLFTIGIIVLEVYLFRKWYEGVEYDERYLTAAIILLLITLIGKSLVLVFFKNFNSDEPNEMRSTEVKKIQSSDGSQIHVEYFGPTNAQLLIFLHGCGTDSTEWYYLKKNLRDTYRLVLVDLIGYGLSDKPKNGDYSLERYAKDLDTIIDDCERPPVLVGHSMGTMIIMIYCRLYLQNKVKSIILCNPTYTNPLKTAAFAPLLKFLEKPLVIPLAYLQIFLEPIFQLSNYLSYLNGSLHLSTAITGFTGSQTRKELEFASKFGITSSMKTVSANTLSMLKYDSQDNLKNIKVPVKIITANEDIVIKAKASQFMADMIATAKLQVVHKAGHMALIEKNEEVIAGFKSFLD